MAISQSSVSMTASTVLSTAALMPLLLLAACSSGNVPLTETEPVAAPLQPLVAPVRPAWAGQLASGTYSCEMGQRVEIRLDDNHNMNLVWQGRTYQMVPVATSTGALRYENKGNGLVWIQIPSKSILLNAKAGQQLANGCRTS